MKIKGAKILLAEDDANLGFVIKDFLEQHSFKVDHKTNGNEAKIAFDRNEYDLCLFDVMLPVKDGFTLAEEIRKSDCEIPIIFITAKNLTDDRIKGYKIGADDYITKPFSTEELLLRIKNIFRRVNFSSELITKPTTFEVGKFSFDFTNQMLISGNDQQKLTKKEAEVLRLLCLNKNNVLKREVALKAVWGRNDYFMGRSMDVYIAKLRKYLKQDPAVEIINIHGEGFRLIVN
jgi:DNA-binding response OmpR family regulator